MLKESDKVEKLLIMISTIWQVCLQLTWKKDDWYGRLMLNWWFIALYDYMEDWCHCPLEQNYRNSLLFPGFVNTNKHWILLSKILCMSFLIYRFIYVYIILFFSHSDSTLGLTCQEIKIVQILFFQEAIIQVY